MSPIESLFVNIILLKEEGLTAKSDLNVLFAPPQLSPEWAGRPGEEIKAQEMKFWNEKDQQ